MMYFKKMSLGLISASLSGIASAAMYMPPPMAEPAPAAAMHGFYAGIGLGGMTLHETATGSGDISLPSGAGISGSGTNNYGSDIGLNSTLLAGYAWSLPHQLFLGAEVFGNYANVGISANSTQTVTGSLGNTVVSDGSGDYNLHYVYGIRALPGYQVNPNVVVYGIAGYSRAHIDSNTNDGSLSIDADTITFPGSSSGYNFNGYQLGLGSMVDVTEHISIRGDFIYSGYQNQTIEQVAADGSGSAVSISSSLEPSTFEADFSIIYRFD